MTDLPRPQLRTWRQVALSLIICPVITWGILATLLYICYRLLKEVAIFKQSEGFLETTYLNVPLALFIVFGGVFILLSVPIAVSIEAATLTSSKYVEIGPRSESGFCASVVAMTAFVGVVLALVIAHSGEQKFVREDLAPVVGGLAVSILILGTPGVIIFLHTRPKTAQETAREENNAVADMQELKQATSRECKQGWQIHTLPQSVMNLIEHPLEFVASPVSLSTNRLPLAEASFGSPLARHTLHKAFAVMIPTIVTDPPCQESNPIIYGLAGYASPTSTIALRANNCPALTKEVFAACSPDMLFLVTCNPRSIVTGNRPDGDLIVIDPKVCRMTLVLPEDASYVKFHHPRIPPQPQIHVCVHPSSASLVVDIVAAQCGGDVLTVGSPVVVSALQSIAQQWASKCVNPSPPEPP